MYFLSPRQRARVSPYKSFKKYIYLVGASNDPLCGTQNNWQETGGIVPICIETPNFERKALLGKTLKIGSFQV